MAFGFNKTRLSPIAIDFGADSLKLLQLAPGDPPQLIAAAAVAVPERARTDASARAAFVADGLREALRGGAFKGRRAVLSFPAFQTLMQHLEIGRAEGESMDELVGAQLRARLALEPTRMIVRHFPARQFVRDGVTLNEVICLAAARDVIHNYIDIAHACKLDVVGMHPEPMAVLKSFEHLYRSAEDQKRVTAFIDIGAASTKVVIAHGAQLRFAKSIHAGGDAITRAVAQSRSVGFDEARRLRRGVGVGEAAAGSPGAGGGAATAVEAPPATGIPALDAQRAADAPPQRRGGQACDTVECITEELQLCLRYHASMFPDRPVEKLVFIGGESRNVATCQAIAKAARIAAQLGDPFMRVARVSQAAPAIGVNLNEPQPGWAVPVGLALCEPAA